MPILGTDFGANVVISSVVPTEMVKNIDTAIADKTAGSAVITWDDEIKYDILNGQLLKF